MRKRDRQRLAKELGRLGGRARAKKMTAAERSESARRAANARHGRRKSLSDKA